MTKCCHCNNTIELPDQLESNVRNYGTESFRVKCSNKKCGRVVRVHAARRVVVDNETFPVNDESYTSW